MIVRVLVIAVAEVLAVRVSVLVPVVDVGENEAVTPLGNPAIARFTLPVKPYSGITVIVALTVCPGLRVKPFDEGARTKVGVWMESIKFAV